MWTLSTVPGPKLLLKEMVSLTEERMRQWVHSTGIRAGRENNQLALASRNSQAPSVQNQTHDSWILIHSSSLSFPPSCWEAKLQYFYYFASLLCILFISVVLPSFWHFFQKPYSFSLLFVFLVKPPIAIMYFSQPMGKFLHCILATLLPSLTWNWMLKFHLLFWLFCFLSTFAIFQNQRFCSWTSGSSWCPPAPRHQRTTNWIID